MDFNGGLRAGGYDYICGVDEAGRGCLAGPLFAAAVILDPSRPVTGLADSKRLSPARREELAGALRARALAYGVASVGEREIDARGIEWANRIAFQLAVEDLLARFPHFARAAVLVVIDGNRRALSLPFPQMCVVRGDSCSSAVGAASILAKTARDAYVLEVIHPAYPHYRFDRHKGYATSGHRAALQLWGPTPFHRRSFRWVTPGDPGLLPGAGRPGAGRLSGG